MIVAVAVCNTAGDSPSVLVVDTERAPTDWRLIIEWQIAYMTAINAGRSTAKLVDTEPDIPTDWHTLEPAQVPLPATVEATATVYYDG